MEEDKVIVPRREKVTIKTSKGPRIIEYDERFGLLTCDSECPYGECGNGLCNRLKDPRDLENPDSNFKNCCIESKNSATPVGKNFDFNNAILVYGTIEQNLGDIFESDLPQNVVDEIPIDSVVKVEANTSKGPRTLEYTRVSVDNPEECLCDTRCPYAKTCDHTKDPEHIDNDFFVFMNFCNRLVVKHNNKSYSINDFVPVEGTIEKNLGDIIEVPKE